MFSGLRYRMDLAWVLTQKELKVRYKSSFLGYLWSVANPLAFAAAFYLAFRVIVRIPVENYPLFAAAGLFPWQWFLNSTSAAAVVFIRNASLMKRVPFPTHYLVLAAVIHDMLHFLFAVPIIGIFAVAYHKPPSPALLWGVPLLLALQLAVTYGLCLVIASVTLFFRDMERLVLIGLWLLFYLTPIIYPETMIPAKWLPMLYFNPIAPLVINWRRLFMEGNIVPHLAAASALHAAVLVAAGRTVYRKLSWKFPEMV